MVAQDDKFRVLRKLPEVRFEEELRGYSKSQVDRVLQGLAPLADDVASLQQRVADAEARAASAEARLVEAHAASRQAAAQASVPVAAPVAPPSFDETLSKTLLLAQRTADQTVADAKVEAEGLVAAARAEAAQLEAENAKARREAQVSVADERQALLTAAHAEVQAKVEAAESSLAEAEGARREALVAEINEFTALRDELGLDIERLEGHLAQRRETIRAALADIAMVVDDPGRLHSEMPPAVGEPVPTPTGALAVVLAVDGLDDLAPATEEPSVSSGVTRASLLGELDGAAGDPTEAVPVVQLFDAEVDQLVDDAGDDPESGLVVDSVTTSEAPTPPAAASPTPFAPEPPTIESLPVEAAVTPSVDEVPSGDDAAEADDLDLGDWGSTSSPAPGAVIVDEVRWDDAPPSAAKPADFGFEDAADHVPTSPAPRDELAEDLGRPAWAESVPDFEPPRAVTKSEDPFLDELRRATGDDAETDVALERFLTDNPDDDDRRSGWFSRRK